MNKEMLDGISKKVMDFTIIQMELDNFTSLTTLYKKRCSSLISLPNKLGNLTSLIILNILNYINL
uniref:Uncharacterized protein n=1 Tax=Physcomitrium patens TaxID=3218 RepID=A0A2K1JKH7_PHYPA|nr:hypothetical protein PHYPA_016909 [Physcomitrium patens]